MTSREALDRLKCSLLDLDMDATVEVADSIVCGDGAATVEEAVDAIAEGLVVVGGRFQEGEWYLAELVYAGEIAKQVMDMLSPHMAVGSSGARGTIVVGTVAGDLHDLGKNIFVSYSKSAGFNIVDLGIDVQRDRFVDAVRENEPLALGLSCLLTSTDAEIGKVIEELKAQGLRDQVKVIVGGAALTEEFARKEGADAFAPDAITGLDIVKDWGVS